ncbi:hypothetical protein PG997_007076 [Apiospora hydei]|uniref:Uncharacterized protein n=1 Tax=Apiospora hydei TaxID=1337664 RepID=A0ABR1WS22_9PEZI
MRSQTLVLMALATLSLGLTVPKRDSELDAILAALEQNNPEDAAAARPASDENNPSKRQLDDADVASILAALQGTDSADAAAAAGEGKVPDKRATDEELAAILDALEKNNPEDAAAAGQGKVPDKRATNEEIESILDALEKNNPEDAAEADAVLP